MPITLQYGPSPAALGRAGFAGGMNQARNQKAAYGHQYQLAMMHLASQNLTAAQRLRWQQTLQQWNAGQAAALEAGRDRRHKETIDQKNQQSKDTLGQRQQQFNYLHIPPDQRNAPAALPAPTAANPPLMEIAPESVPQQGHGATVMMPTFHAPQDRNAPMPAVQSMPPDELRQYVQRPTSSLGVTAKNAPMGYGSRFSPADFAAQYQNEKSFQRGMGQSQPGPYDQAYQQALAHRDAWRTGSEDSKDPGFWYNQPGAGQVTTSGQALAEGNLKAKGYLQGPNGWYRPVYKPNQQGPATDFPEPPMQDPTHLAATGLVPQPLNQRHQELYAQYQQLLS